MNIILVGKKQKKSIQSTLWTWCWMAYSSSWRTSTWINFWFLISTSIHPRYCPVVIIEPPGLWNKDIRVKLAAPFQKQFCSPKVALHSLTCSDNLGRVCLYDISFHVPYTVIHISPDWHDLWCSGREKVMCNAVCRGRLCPNSLSCDSSCATRLVSRNVAKSGENSEI